MKAKVNIEFDLIVAPTLAPAPAPPAPSPAPSPGPCPGPCPAPALSPAPAPSPAPFPALKTRYWLVVSLLHYSLLFPHHPTLPFNFPTRV